MKVGVLLIILAVEALLNGSFLAKGSVFGLVGGVFEALIIAAINVVLGWGVGRLIVPWIGYRNWFARIFGVLGLAVYVGLAVGFNLAVSRLTRDGLPTDLVGNRKRQLPLQGLRRQHQTEKGDHQTLDQTPNQRKIATRNPGHFSAKTQGQISTEINTQSAYRSARCAE